MHDLGIARAIDLELEVSANPHAIRLRTNRDQALRVFFALCEKHIDWLQHTLKKASEAAVTWEGSVGDSSIHYRDPGAMLPR
jgi:hypothetical protein